MQFVEQHNASVSAREVDYSAMRVAILQIRVSRRRVALSRGDNNIIRPNPIFITDISHAGLFQPASQSRLFLVSPFIILTLLRLKVANTSSQLSELLEMP